MPREASRSERARVRFYVDEDILGLGYGLMWLRHDVTTCAQPPFAERLPRGIADTDWIPVAAEVGLVGITNNRKIRTNPVEAGIAVSSGAPIIGLAGKAANGTSWDKATLLVRHWARSSRSSPSTPTDRGGWPSPSQAPDLPTTGPGSP